MLDRIKGKNRTLIVLGDMLELGKNEKDLHKNLLKHIRENNFHQTFIYGVLMHELYLESKRAKFQTEIKYYNNQKLLISDLKNTIKANDIVYIKGSRGMKMENII